MPPHREWFDQPTDGEGWYWADDGHAIRLYYVERIAGLWMAWNPLKGGLENYQLSQFVKWSARVKPPLPDEEL